MGYVSIVVPTINVNDDKVILGSKEFENLDEVNKGDIICCFETSKTTEDFTIEYDGYIVWLYDDFDEIRVGHVFCEIYDSREEAEQRLNTTSVTPKLPEGVNASKKAVEYAMSIGFDITQIKKKGIIKTNDIDTFLKSKKEDGDSINDNVQFIFNNEEKRVAILGAGRGSMQIIDLISHIKGYRTTMLFDDDEKLVGKDVDSIPVVGKIDFDLIESIYKQGQFDYIVNGIGGSCEMRKYWFDELTKRGILFCNCIHPSVIIGNHVKMGSGNVIMPMTHIGSHTEIGNNCFITAKTSIEHHNILGSHCTFGPGVMTSGSVTIGECTKFGAGVFVEPLVKIGSNCRIASGSILTNHVPSDSIVRTKVNLDIIPNKK